MVSNPVRREVTAWTPFESVMQLEWHPGCTTHSDSEDELRSRAISEAEAGGGGREFSGG